MRRRTFTAALLGGGFSFAFAGCLSRGTDPYDGNGDASTTETDETTIRTEAPTKKGTQSGVNRRFEAGSVRFRVIRTLAGQEMPNEDSTTVEFHPGDDRATITGYVHIDECYHAALGNVRSDESGKHLTVVVERDPEAYAASEVQCEHYTAEYRAVVTSATNLPDEITVVHRGPDGEKTLEETVSE